MTKLDHRLFSVLWDNGDKPACPWRDHDIQPFTGRSLQAFMCQKCGHKFRKDGLERIEGKWRMIDDQGQRY